LRVRRLVSLGPEQVLLDRGLAGVQSLPPTRPHREKNVSWVPRLEPVELRRSSWKGTENPDLPASKPLFLLTNAHSVATLQQGSTWSNVSSSYSASPSGPMAGRVIRLDHLIAVGRGLRLRVDSWHWLPGRVWITTA